MALALFNCFYECKSDSLLKCPDMQLPQCWEMIGNMKSFIDEKKIKPQFDKVHVISFMGLGLTPSDCIAIGYYMRMNTLFVKEKSVIYFEMGICSDTGMTSFMKELRKGVNTKTPTQLMVNLGFYNYTLGNGSLLPFKDLLKGQSNIGTLHINTSDVSAENVTVALKSIIEGLADGSSCCGISIGHIALKSIHAYYLALLLCFYFTR